MNYSLWLENRLASIRNKNKYMRLKNYIKNIKESPTVNRINNMLLASACYDIEHFTNTNMILNRYIRRYYNV